VVGRVSTATLPMAHSARLRNALSALPSLGMWWRDVVAADFNGLTGRTIETKYFGRRPKA
jgi:hypothetical protein